MWNQEFQQQEKSGKMPNLTFMWLMTDHTAGVGTGDPDPVAEAADNDLAVGRVVDEISHSKFWKSTAIFVDEDDTQNGVDHVDGHRDPVFVISPYSAGGVQDQYDSQLNMVRTIEQILGIKPMNQEDGAAEPMYSAFTATPNDAPVQRAVQPDPAHAGGAGLPEHDHERAAEGDRRGAGIDAQGLPGVGAVEPERMRGASTGSGPARTPPTRRSWTGWTGTRPTTGRSRTPATSGSTCPDQVPGRNLPNAFIGN